MFRHDNLEYIKSWIANRLNNELGTIETEQAMTPGTIKRIAEFTIYDAMSGKLPLCFIRYRADEYTRDQVDADNLASTYEVRFRARSNNTGDLTRDMLYYTDATARIISADNTLGGRFEYVDKIRTQFPDFFPLQSGGSGWDAVIVMDIQTNNLEY